MLVSMNKFWLAFVLICFTWTSALAQSQIKGTVVSSTDGLPLPGVTVLVKNTTSGVVTDYDGKYTVSAPADGVLAFSFIGFTSQEIEINGQTTIDVTLQEESEMLEDLVVIGYGVQKKSVVTASIAKVDADALDRVTPVRVDNALKGLASGVTVTSSSGQPGAAARIRIRGIGTINNSDPLYIVDGMPIEGGLDYLNPSDIASIEVLKDAASGAVYGARAANGVVLVTTKSGKQGSVRANYDFYQGWQSAWKHRDVLDATQYAIMKNEGKINAGIAPEFDDPYSYGKGTDWQDLVFNDGAKVVSHQASISGANDKVNYLISFGYYDQEGIVGGNYDRSNYKRTTLRSNTQYNVFDVTKERNWLSKFVVTSNISYAKIKSRGIETNSTWGSPLGSALAMSPILTPYVEGDALEKQLAYFNGNSDYVPMYGANGKLLMTPIAFGNYQEMKNPIAALSMPGEKGWSHKFVANFSGELTLWDNLRFKTSYGADLSFWGNDGYTPIYYMRSGESRNFSSAYSSRSTSTVWQIENVLMYDKTIDVHTFSVVLGQSAKQYSGNYLSGSRNNVTSYDQPYIDASTGQAADGDQTSSGAPYAKNTLASMFGRFSYDFNERYMAQLTIRRDGSSRFGANNHWAVFPSFSLGWNLTNEAFMESRPEWLTSTKVRYSWGKNGNENIGNFRYMTLTSSNNNAIFGAGENVLNGVKASNLPNPDLKWEESIQTNVGVDFGFLGNSLTFSADYYKKTTDGMLMDMTIPSYVGEQVPVGNVGKMENSGFEVELSWKHQFGDINVHVGGNASYLKNELIEYGNEAGWANLDSFQGTGAISRAENGKPFPFFYGYKTSGVFQNDAEAAEYNTTYKLSKGDKFYAVAGDVRFVDVDGNKTIDEDDRTDIGKGMPDWTFGFNAGFEWKGIDFNMVWQGTAGNDIYDATRRTDALESNLPSWMLNRWTGEGTSNKLPRYVQGDARNWQSSDLLVFDGSYLRLKNVQLGYTLPKSITRKFLVDHLRIYAAAENLLTFTKYHGFDPEISSGGTSLGIDYGVYPQARVISVGLNLGF